MDDLTDEWLNDISGLRPAARTADANGKAAPPQAEQAQAATAAPVSGPVENAAFANGPAANAPNGVFPARKAPPRAPESVWPPPAEARSPEASVAPAHPGVAEQVRPRTDADDWNLDDGGFVGKRVDISSLPLRRGRQPDELPAGQPEPGAAPHIAPSNVAPPNISPPQVAGPPALASPEDRKAEVPSLAPQPLPQPPQTRWDAPAEQESRFAPRGRHGRAHAAEPRSRMPETGDAQSPPVAAAPEAYFGEEDHPQESLPPRSRLAGLLGRTGTRAPEPGLDDDMFPADDDLMPFETDDLKGLIGRRRPPIGLLAGGLLLAVVAIGGGAALFLMNSGGGTGGPIIVAAESGPFKITPEPIEAGAGEPNKLIYDRVDGSSDGGQEVVVLQPGAEVPVDRSVDPADSPIARVILPDPISGGGPPSGEGLLAQEPPAEAPDLGPRRVRTVVVRPDGTIVSNTTEGASDSGGSALVVEPEPPVANDDTLAIAGSGAGGNGELAITPDPPPAVATPSPPQQALALAPEPVTPQPAAPQPVAPAPAQRAAPAPVQPPAQAAGPIDLSPSGGTTQSASQAASGGMLVQISSQRSEDAALATFRDLKARYPRILGPFNVDIQRADLGARGIYFRVRVGPFSANDAQRLCDDLKAAGGDCILSRS